MSNVLKGVLSLRVSSPGQGDQFGLDVQEELGRNYAADNDITIERVFSDEAGSTTSELENRLEWLAMLDYLTLNPDITVIIIGDLSRLARDLMLQETMLADLRRRGITLISVREPDLCANDPSRTLIRQVIGAINEYDRCMIVARLALGRAARAKTGERSVGGMPIGYHMEVINGRHTTVVDEAEAVVVRHVKHLRDVRKLPFQKIADWLNDERYRPKNWTPEKPTKFHNSTVQKIYNRQLYDGITSHKVDASTTITKTNDKLRIL